ncbi:MAG: MetQ/NlpA family ABC transporter substrate-binding protein [Desulfovibrio sp.]|nr:MetQ/NlpA family ABC transporter substrate-binding protein [Desulfovibrio sp.]
MKRLCAFLVCLCLVLSCGLVCAGEHLVIGVTPYPHKDIMTIAKTILEKKGYTVTIKEFTDYVQPNIALAHTLLFANYFQHKPYLDNMNAEKNLHLVSLGGVHIEPLGVYSKKIKQMAELSKGNTVSVPNDPTNEARALRLLEAQGIIKVKAGDLVTVADIVDNPFQLKFFELEAAQLPRALDDVTMAVINTNFAGEAGLIPSRDALAMESKDSPYANIVVVREEDKDSQAAKDLLAALQSEEVKHFIEQGLVHKGIVPAF